MERICIACKYFNFDTGVPDWSDETPGEDMRVECLKRHWVIDSDAGGITEQFFWLNMNAKTCPDFDPSDIAKRHGW